MPNWCEGTLKMRGNPIDIAWCLKECLVAVEEGHIDENCNYIEGAEYPAVITLNEDGEISAKYPPEYKGYKGGFWIKGSRRHFVGDGGGLYSDCGRGDGNVAIFDSFKAAWCIDEEPFKSMAQKYNIDIRIEGYEMGMQFSQVVEVHKDGTVRNEQKTYDNWEWDCPCPDLGG